MHCDAALQLPAGSYDVVWQPCSPHGLMIWMLLTVQARRARVAHDEQRAAAQQRRHLADLRVPQPAAVWPKHCRAADRCGCAVAQRVRKKIYLSINFPAKIYHIILYLWRGDVYQEVASKPTKPH
eukprot:gene23815-biopygen7338